MNELDRDTDANAWIWQAPATSLEKPIGYMMLLERQAYEEWAASYFAPVEGETMGDAFKRRIFELEGHRVFAIPDKDNARFSSREHAMEVLSHPDYITRGGALGKYKLPVIVGERAELNPEWENAPYIAIICFPVPQEMPKTFSF